jgi:thiol-disulfide isomerase/thioredoxin
MRRLVSPLMWTVLLVWMTHGQAAHPDALPEGVRHYDAPAPAFDLSDMDGERFALAEGGNGGWLFVHFWASWCGPCRREMPAIQRMDDQLGEHGPRILLINTAENDDTVFSFLAETAPELESLMDRDGLVTEAWRPRGLPATYLVDPRGRIRYQALGGRAWDQPPYLDFVRNIAR